RHLLPRSRTLAVHHPAGVAHDQGGIENGQPADFRPVRFGQPGSPDRLDPQQALDGNSGDIGCRLLRLCHPGPLGLPGGTALLDPLPTDASVDACTGVALAWRPDPALAAGRLVTLCVTI